MAVNATFPEDVTLKILARLSVKSLKRFHCIQKSWLALIQNPEFAFAYITFSGAKAYPLVQRDNDVTKKPIISLLSNETLDVKSDDDDIVIWNPATKEFKLILDLEVDNLGREPYGCSSMLSLFNYFWDAVGFGHDSETDDYKVTPFPDRVFGNFYPTSKIAKFMEMDGCVARVFCSNHEEIDKDPNIKTSNGFFPKD
ncbi:putative F-box protein At3g16210 [Durio zibethinus]|uniref:F-box protein At3g16210 n=1 Tax=Durio zibethinus TaxID=66656 RepID=A0A6P5ZHA4_DURZI|nr:putative F-box protein At3g16210 [Durio zibethinus]